MKNKSWLRMLLVMGLICLFSVTFSPVSGFAQDEDMGEDTEEVDEGSYEEGEEGEEGEEEVEEEVEEMPEEE